MGDDVEFENAECVRATAMALLVCIDDRQVWIPQSQISDESEVWRVGDKGKLVITEWIAIEKELV